MTDKLKEKLGDWLLDIAKYLMTAVALTSAFKGFGEPFMSIMALLISGLLLAIGIIFIQASTSNNSNRNNIVITRNRRKLYGIALFFCNSIADSHSAFVLVANR